MGAKAVVILDHLAVMLILTTTVEPQDVSTELIVVIVREQESRLSTLGLLALLSTRGRGHT